MKKLTNHKDIERTDEDRHRQDRQDKTKQENASYDMSFFKKKQKSKRFLDIKKL